MTMLPRRKPGQHWGLGLLITERYSINKLRNLAWLPNDCCVTSYSATKKYKNLPITHFNIIINNGIIAINLAIARLSRRSLFVFDNG